MSTRYGVMTDYEYEGKRTHLTIWSGPFYSQYEGEAYSRPKGWTIKLDYIDEPIRVDGPNTRNETNYEKVDALISEAIKAHLAKHGYTEVTI